MHYRLLAFFLFAFLSKSLAHEGKKSLSYPFIENKGQWNEQVKFKSDLEGATIYFESNAFHYQFKNSPNFHAGNVPEDSITRGHVFNANFIGSNKSIDFGKQGRSYFYKNYFLGNEKSKWASNVHSYSAITYKELYNGIDLEVYLHEGFMKYDYHISPGTSPEIIEVEYEGVDKVSIEEGALIIHHSLGKLIEEKPYAYQMVNGLQTEVPCFYKFLENGHLGFEFPKGYSRELELIIDPTLVFSTYSGSTADNFGQTATYDQEGNGYMGGIADGTGYVVSPGAYQRTFGGDDWDIAITKFKYTGDSIRYSTYIGGNRNETVHSLVVDNESNLYLLGATSSTNYPTTTSAVQSNKILSSGIIFTDIDVEFRNGVDIVVTKLDSLGSSLLGSTYYGGSNSDGINQNPTSGGNYDGLNFNYGDHHRGEIIIDSLGACYIGTTTYSDNLATVASSRGGGQDGLVVKFNNDLSSVIWSRYIGGTGRDAINSLKVIDNNRVLIGGGTTSFTSFPTTPNA